MKVYYAHCMALYGTEQEKRDLETLERLGLEVVNPNNPDLQAKAVEQEKQGWSPMFLFRPYVEGCEVFAFRALPDGSIPAGVGVELVWARAAKKIIIELPGIACRKYLSVEDTKVYLKEVGEF